MHECIMYISMILMHACIYDVANFVPDGPTNKAILGVGFKMYRGEGEQDNEPPAETRGFIVVRRIN